MRRMAKRMKEIGDIFCGVFGNAQMMTTVRPTLAVQLANINVRRQELLFVDAVYGPPKNYFYGMAGVVSESPAADEQCHRSDCQ